MYFLSLSFSVTEIAVYIAHSTMPLIWIGLLCPLVQWFARVDVVSHEILTVIYWQPRVLSSNPSGTPFSFCLYSCYNHVGIDNRIDSLTTASTFTAVVTLNAVVTLSTQSSILTTVVQKGNACMLLMNAAWQRVEIHNCWQLAQQSKACTTV